MNSKTQTFVLKANSTTKKAFIAIALFLTISSGVFAYDAIENNKVAAAFKASFPEAKNVTWSTTANFTKVSFSWNNENITAFYEPDGTAVATSRPLDLKSLPLKAFKELQSDYQDYTILEAIEFDDVAEGLSYFVAVTKNDTKLILKINGQGEINVYKKLKV